MAHEFTASRTSSRIQRSPEKGAASGHVDNRLHNNRPEPSDIPIGIPDISSDLISYLKNRYFTRLAVDKTLRDYDRMLGHDQVIEHLESLYKEQNGTS